MDIKDYVIQAKKELDKMQGIVLKRQAKFPATYPVDKDNSYWRGFEQGYRRF